MFEKTSRKYLKYQKKCYLCTVKSVVDASCFSSDKRLEMRIFDGLSGWIRLAGKTVDCYGYGRKTSVYLGVAVMFIFVSINS